MALFGVPSIGSSFAALSFRNKKGKSTKKAFKKAFNKAARGPAAEAEEVGQAVVLSPPTVIEPAQRPSSRSPAWMVNSLLGSESYAKIFEGRRAEEAAQAAKKAPKNTLA